MDRLGQEVLLAQGYQQIGDRYSKLVGNQSIIVIPQEKGTRPYIQASLVIDQALVKIELFISDSLAETEEFMMNLIKKLKE